MLVPPSSSHKSQSRFLRHDLLPRSSGSSHFVSAMASLGAASVEYITLKESLGVLTDCLLGNVPVISLLSTQLFASHLIPKAVNAVAQNDFLPAPNRANAMFSSVLSKMETHDNPSKTFSSLITSLKEVGLNDIASKLEERLSKLYQ